MSSGSRKVFAYSALARAISIAPARATQRVAKVVGDVMWRADADRRLMCARHMRRVLEAGGQPIDNRTVDVLVRKAFNEYARYWVEGAQLPSVSPDEIRRRMEVEEGWDDFRSAHSKGNGVILALPHVGAWEWGGAFLALEGMPMTAVAEELEPPELFEFFVEQRESIGLSIIALGPGSSTAVMKTLREGGLIGLLSDRDIVGSGIEVEFFGERTTLPGGAATLALRTGAALFAGVVYRGPGPNHTAVISPQLDTERRDGLRADVSRITQEIANHFEGFISRHPEQWHLFQPNWPSDAEIASK